MAGPAARRAAGERALAYVRERSDPAAVGDRLAAIVDREVSDVAAAQPRGPEGALTMNLRGPRCLTLP